MLGLRLDARRFQDIPVILDVMNFCRSMKLFAIMLDKCAITNLVSAAESFFELVAAD